MDKKFDYVYGANVEREYPNVHLSIERITPEIASRMLETNIHNRALSRQSLEHALVTNQWLLNGDAIVFCEEGWLLNG